MQVQAVSDAHWCARAAYGGFVLGKTVETQAMHSCRFRLIEARPNEESRARQIGQEFEKRKLM